MRCKFMIGTYLILVLLLLSVLPVSALPRDSPIPEWNTGWSYRQQLQIPISTGNLDVAFQPIDLNVVFDHPCWAQNETIHSIRICDWDGTMWHELESQIYDMEYTEESTTVVRECNVVFLIPEHTTGNEQYYVYYDDQEKSPPMYPDHVSVEDASYSSSPLPDIKAEAMYYGIREDGYIVYGVGQSGEFLDRSLAQVVVKQKPKSEQFDIVNADQIASFSFSYAIGKKEGDEVSSDQTLMLKKIFTDGNLMVSFGIISESSTGELRTSALYKYYYSPETDKRICVHVKHEVLRDVVVKGDENLDGRFGALISFKSRNPTVEKLNFGDILPFLDVAGESNTVDEYPLDTNPESKNREWVISFADDVDLGSEAWLAYGEGKTGKTHSLIFSSNSGIVKAGINERDGIQVKVAEREYFNFLGTEVDYASINFGRNSYEKGYSHDLLIPGDLVVEFDAELFSSEQGGYAAVQEEAQLYHDLAKCRSVSQGGSFEQRVQKFPVTVVTHFGGTRFSFPWFVNRTGLSLPVMRVELCSYDGTVIASGIAERSLLTRAYTVFSNVSTGEYLVKVYRVIQNRSKVFTGARVLYVNGRMVVHVFCTWQRTVQVAFHDQHDTGISDVKVLILNTHDIVFAENRTDAQGQSTLYIPHSSRDVFRVQAWYHDFIVYEGELDSLKRKISVSSAIGLYDFTVEVRDQLGFSPGVEVHPMLSSIEYDDAPPILAVSESPGSYRFTRVPSGMYRLQLSYGAVLDEEEISVPECGDLIHLPFRVTFSLGFDVYDNQGNALHDDALRVVVIRENKEVKECVGNDRVCTLPPAHYTLNAYQGNTFIGQNEIFLTSDQSLQLVTTVQSLIPLVLLVISCIAVGVVCVLLFLKKITLFTLLKVCALVLLLISLVQPWWMLSGSSTSPMIERRIQMYVHPQVMIETTTTSERTTYSLAAMPDIYLDFLSKVFIAVGVLAVVILFSILLDIVQRKKYVIILTAVCTLMLALLGIIYYTGTSKLCEASVGSIQGTGILSFLIDNQDVMIASQWGLASGFYLVILSILVLSGATLWQLKNYVCLRKRNSKQSKP
ncbi:MAG: carboxypeptidase regulatory-like domain-containing protein [Methanobacteriota archaeon]